MKFHTQEFRHDPENGLHGDCQRAVVASLLGLELSEVPNFNEGGPDSYDFFERLDSFLASQGLGRLSVAFNGDSIDHATRHMAAHFSENQPYMLSGKSPRGVNHVVIFKGVDLLWDTHPEGGGLVGPCSDGYYWVEVLTPLIQVPPAADQKGGAASGDVNIVDSTGTSVWRSGCPQSPASFTAALERIAELEAELASERDELHRTRTALGLLRVVLDILRDALQVSEEPHQTLHARMLEAATQKPSSISRAAQDVLAERRRQIEAEGWTPEHDDAHEAGTLALAAACYAAHAGGAGKIGYLWRWHPSWWKPSTPRRDLVKAGALILAEVERIDRAAQKPEGGCK